MATRVVVVLVVVVLATCLLFAHDVDAKKKGGKAAKKWLKQRMYSVVKDLQSNVTALWGEVKQLSQPVHVHLHGDGHVMNPGAHHGHREDDDHEEHHDHDHKDDHHHKSHDDEGKSSDHHSKEEKMKMMSLKKMKSGHHHSHGEEEEEEEEEEEMYHHGGHRDTHVHIHLHTGMEEGPKHHQAHSPPPDEYRYARCDVVANSALPFQDRQEVKGTIFFRQKPDKAIEVTADLQGFVVKQNSDKDYHHHLKGLHGHEFGDLSNGCNSLGGHMNPYGVAHGGPQADHRHIGDFGNLEVQQDGTAVRTFTDDVASLYGSYTVLGRSMVIHAGADDHGHGGSEASKKSGSSGARLACCVIVASGEPPAGVWSDRNN